MNENLFKDVTKSLEIEVKELSESLSRSRSANDSNGYLTKIKALRETLDLLTRYENYTLEDFMIKLSKCWTDLKEDYKNSLAEQLVGKKEAKTLIELIDKNVKST